MSGFVGIASDNPGLLNPELLRDLTDALRFRGPDACHTWMAPGVGFGHTLLSTVDDVTVDRQPCTIDGDLWITADVRLDGRADLIQDLSTMGQPAAAGATDAQLVLQAYRAWAEHSVEHLLGDFAFAIWDGARRRLFCARDHFGVKPFFYAQPRASLICSNTLECVRRHPAVSDRLDDLSIADFLLFKYSQRPDATAFEAVRRLPPGHWLTWSPGGPAAIHQYWRLSSEAPVRYRDSREYVDRFRELLQTAVRDRLRTRRIAVSMSGGLDSSAIAAVARPMCAPDGAPIELVAHTMVFDHLVPDEERAFAGAVAAHLSIPIHFLAADEYPPFANSAAVPYDLPEPSDSAYRTLDLDFHAAIAATSRVVLSGMDADSFLSELTLDHFAALARGGRVGQLAGAMARYTRAFRRRPPLGIRRMTHALVGQSTPSPSMPAWMNPELVDRLALRERLCAASETPRRSSLRPRSMRASGTTLWTTVFGRGDAESTRQPLEFRYPFADLRLVRYLLAIPVVPWCTDKLLLRKAMAGELPEQIRRRRKTPMAIDPLRPALKRSRDGWLDGFDPAAPLERYIIRRAVPSITGETGDDVYVNMRPLCLSRWLDRQPRMG